MKRLFSSPQTSSMTLKRAGFTTPAAAVALLVIMLGLALIVDRIWLETARLELTTAAQAASLAACRELVSDVQLVSSSAADLQMTNAREVAGWIASQNIVGGVPVSLNTSENGDIRFGNLVQNVGGVQFVESNSNPNTVVVTALRTRSNNNPVALVLGGIIGLSSADVAVRVEATINNDVIGLRPISGSPIPALPIAIWELDPSGASSHTWNTKIELGLGQDQFSFDDETHAVIAVGDGIPEIVLQGTGTSSSATAPNVRLLDLGTGLTDLGTLRQIQSGLSIADLDNLDGEILVGQGASMNFQATSQLSKSHSAAFENLIGEPRICFLYSTVSAGEPLASNKANCTELIAIRIMSVNTLSDGTCTVTVQPTVMTTRSAVLASENTLIPNGSNRSGDPYVSNASELLPNDGTWSGSETPLSTNVVPNRYVYKLRLTY